MVAVALWLSLVPARPDTDRRLNCPKPMHVPLRLLPASFYSTSLDTTQTRVHTCRVCFFQMLDLKSQSDRA